MTGHAPLLVLISQDLFFSTGLQDVATAAGWMVQLVDSPDQLGADGEQTDRPIPLTEPLDGPDGRLVQTLSAWRPGLVLIDLTSEAIPWAHWIQVLKTSAATRRIPIAVFGPHVATDAFDRAAAAGVDVQLTRGQVRGKLPSLLENHARVPDQASLVAACAEPLSEQAEAGIKLHNAGEFFEAHELLEAAWMETSGEAGYLYRALLQITVAHLHISRDNRRGAAKMLLRLHQWLDPLPPVCRGVDVAVLHQIVDELRAGLNAADGSAADPDLTRIHPFKLVSMDDS